MPSRRSGPRSLLLGQGWRFICKDNVEGMAAITSNPQVVPSKGFGSPASCTNLHHGAARKGEDGSQETPDEIGAAIPPAGTKLLSYLRQKPLSLPDIEEFVRLLNHCRKKGDQVLALLLNTFLCEIGLEAHRSLGNHLVLLFCELGRVDLALIVFNRLTHRIDHSWNSLVIGYAISGNPLQAFALYQKLKENLAISFSGYAFVVLLRTCTKRKDVETGLELHVDVARAGLLETDVFVGSALVDMYAKCGLLTRAQEVFDHLLVRDAVSWNALITGYANYEHGDEALNCFELMQVNGFSPTDVTFVSSLRACGCAKALEKGQQIHSRIRIFGPLEKNIVIGNALVAMYTKCGSLLKAQEVFDKLQGRDVVSWNTLITGYIEHGHDKEAVKCFDLMQHDVVLPDAVTFICSLKACGNLKAVDKGQELHVEIERKGLLETDPVVGNALVDMYARCGSLYRAHQVVKMLPWKSTVMWNALITGYVDHDHNEEALECFKEMQLNPGIIPDAATFICTLKASSSMGMLDEVCEIHAEAQRRGFVESNLLVGSALVNVYAKCGALSKAEEVFERLPLQGIVAWTALISGYTEHGHAEAALKCLRQMQLDGLTPDAVTYVCILKACGSIKDLEKGQEVHSEIDKLGLLRTDVSVASTLVNMYAKCGMLDKAKMVFSKLPIRDVVTWNTLIAGYVDHGQGEEAIELFEQMQSESILASDVTFICILKACGNAGDIEKGEEIYAEISRIEALNSNHSLGNNLVDMYAKFGLMMKAREVFDNLQSRDTVSWNVLLTGYVEHGHAEEALNCFEQMECDGVSPDNISLVCGLKACGSIGATVKGCDMHAEIERLGLLERDFSIGTNLLDMYAKCGELNKAQEVFDELLVQDVVAWTALIAGYAENGYDEEALDCFDGMQFAGIHPDAFTFVWSLKACASLGATEKGQEIHAEMERKGLLERDLILGNALLDAYVKCGLLTKAQQVFENLPERDLISWNSLLIGYVQLGESENAFRILDRMLGEGLKPGPITFTVVLSACSHVGLVEKGQSYFEVMCKDHGITPMLEHCTCMVDLLGRSGKLQQAMSIIKDSLPSTDTDLAVWHAMLKSCTDLGDVDLARRAFQQAVLLNKEHSSSYVFMSKLFLDRWEQAL